VKKILVLGLAVVLCLSLVGCGEKQEEDYYITPNDIEETNQERMNAPEMEEISQAIDETDFVEEASGELEAPDIEEISGEVEE